jgi:hypothetical protein
MYFGPLILLVIALLALAIVHLFLGNIGPLWQQL